MQNSPKVAVIDSGAGGISILSEILKKAPCLSYIYVADHGGFPYGTLQSDTLLKRLTTIVSIIINDFKPQIIVIACNTASTLALDSLRAQFTEIDFVGVVPAIKPATQITTTKHIGILATPATIIRKYTHNLVEEFASACTVSFYGSTKLVQIAEDGINGLAFTTDQITEEIEKLFIKDKQIDTIVLACTHFPLLRQEIETSSMLLAQKYQTNNVIRIIDSGEAIARRVTTLLTARQICTDTDTPNIKSELIYLSTSNDDALIEKLTKKYDSYFNKQQIEFKERKIQSSSKRLQLPAI